MPAGLQENKTTEAMLKRELGTKPEVPMEEFNKYAAIFDIDGMSWSDRYVRLGISLIQSLC